MQIRSRGCEFFNFCDVAKRNHPHASCDARHRIFVYSENNAIGPNGGSQAPPDFNPFPTEQCDAEWFEWLPVCDLAKLISGHVSFLQSRSDCAIGSTRQIIWE
jgi:hypothetical protein